MMETLLSNADDLKYLLEELAIPSTASVLPSKLESSLQSFYKNSIAVTSKKFGSFDNLIVDNLDPDSIWEEIRSRCDPLSKYLEKKISSIEDRLIAKEQVDYDNGGDDNDEEDDEDNHDEVDDDGDAFSDNVDDDDDEDVDNKDDYDFNYADKDEDTSDDMADDDDDDDDLDNDTNGNIKDNEDDEIMGGGMEEYLDAIERDEMRREAKAMRKTATEKGHKGLLEYDEDAEEDDEEYVQRVMYQDDDDNDDNDEEDEEDEEQVGGVEGKGIMYSDFFFPPPGSSTSSHSSSSTNNKSFINNNSNNKNNNKQLSSSSSNNKASNSKSKSKNKMKVDATIVGAKVKAGEAKHQEDEEMYYNENDDDDDDDDDDENDDDFDNLVDDYNDEEEDEESKELKHNTTKSSTTTSTKPLTPYEKKQLLKRQEIAALEAAVTGQKSWDMRGEIKGADRPENSLLELTADIERASKPAPVVTESYTSSIEELIIKRVMEEQYDDVIPQETINTDDLEDDGHGIPAAVSQEKSKLGLGEVYANEYLLRAGHQSTTSAAASEAEDVLRKTVKGLFHKICRDLDSLSNFYFTPKPVAAEGSVTATAAVPAILLEDVAPYRPHALAPVSVTDSQGPEQLYAKKRGREGALLTVNDKELTQHDRKRIRRARKETQHKINIQEKGQEKLIAKANKHSKEYVNYENQKTDEVLKFDKRVTVGKQTNRYQTAGGSTASSAVGDTGSSGGSSNFFEQLQEQVANDIQRKANSMNIGSNGSSSSHKKNKYSDDKNSNNNSNKKSASNVYKL